MKGKLKLTLVTNKANSSLKDYLNFISKCVHSGLSAVQIREKNLGSTDLLEFARLLHAYLLPLNIPLIVNDSLDLCLAINAEGLHLGQTDGDIHFARQLLGPNKIIGLSVNTLEQLEYANNLPIDYIGIGAIYPTQHKPNVQTIWKIEGLKKAVKIAHHPVIAIGGVDESNVHHVMKTGVTGIAGISVFHNAKCPEVTTKNLLEIICREISA